MKWLWTWSGECFGYREGDDLWTYSGKHVGQFFGDEVYGSDGRYLGEIMDQEFLITNTGKSSWAQSAFTPYGNRGGYAKYASYAGYAMYTGHQDFPSPESFR